MVVFVRDVKITARDGVSVPVVKDLLIKPLDESWYPPAHLGGRSERLAAWP